MDGNSCIIKKVIRTNNLMKEFYDRVVIAHQVQFETSINKINSSIAKSITPLS